MSPRANGMACGLMLSPLAVLWTAISHFDSGQ